MSIKVEYTTKFKKDISLLQKQGKDLSKVRNVIDTLAAGEPLDRKFKDHALSGEYADCRECHITPDWLLIYRIDEGRLVLILTRTGSHSNLFG